MITAYNTMAGSARVNRSGHSRRDSIQLGDHVSTASEVARPAWLNGIPRGDSIQLGDPMPTASEVARPAWFNGLPHGDSIQRGDPTPTASEVARAIWFNGSGLPHRDSIQRGDPTAVASEEARQQLYRVVRTTTDSTITEVRAAGPQTDLITRDPNVLEVARYMPPATPDLTQRVIRDDDWRMIVDDGDSLETLIDNLRSDSQDSRVLRSAKFRAFLKAINFPGKIKRAISKFLMERKMKRHGWESIHFDDNGEAVHVLA